MLDKLKRIENLILAIIIINILIFLADFLGVPSIVSFIMMMFFNILFIILIYKSSSKLKEYLESSRNLLPKSVNKAISYDEYSILTYDKENFKIVWENEYFNENFGSVLNEDVRLVFDGFLFNKDFDKDYLKYNDHYFKVIEDGENFILKDVSEYISLKEKYEGEKNCILYIKIDNLDDLGTTLDENIYQNIVLKVRSLISEFTSQYDCILRRYKTDSYIIFAYQKDILDMIDKAQILLEKVRTISDKEDEKITLSIGIAIDYLSLRQAQTEAGKSIDMALARGGDQIVVKKYNEDYVFYGGVIEAVEKRSRVRVRLIVRSLETLIQQSSNVIIMPHKNADLDAIGACLGLHEFVKINNKEAYICADESQLDETARNGVETLDLTQEYKFYNEDELISVIDNDTLLIIADASNINLFESYELYQKINRTVIIDHHRRSKEYDKNPLLSYVEPSASSSVELVCELLRFQTKSFTLSSEVATLMLAGMMIDTAYFTLRTGVRTFEAATFLKEYHASALLAKEILQVSRESYQKKLAIVKDAQFIDDNIAVSTYTEEPITRLLLAQAAVELLDLKDVIASFTLGYLENGSVGVSARSNGEFNVQLVMEAIGGGGHLSMAGANVNGDINDVRKEIIDYIEKERK